MTDCIFCKIIAGEIPSTQAYSDEQVYGFRDIHPVAPTHVLIVPRKHFASVNALEPEDEVLVGHMFSVARAVAEQEGVAANGYRLIINTGADAGQEVFHLHLHLIGGQHMRYPMG